MLVDIAHVENFEAGVVHQFLFIRIDRADADLAHRIRADHGRRTGHFGQFARTEAAQAGHRHSVDVARRRDLRGIEVGVRVQPQHPQLATLVAAMARHGADRSDREAVVAAQHDRHATGLEFRRFRFQHCAIPGDDFREMPVAGLRRLPGIDRPGEIAAIDHVQPAIGECPRQARHAQGLRAHRGTARTRADVGGNAEQGNRFLCAGHAPSPDDCGRPKSIARRRVRNHPCQASRMAASRTAVSEATATMAAPRSRHGARPESKRSSSRAASPTASSP